MVLGSCSTDASHCTSNELGKRESTTSYAALVRKVMVNLPARRQYRHTTFGGCFGLLLGNLLKGKWQANLQIRTDKDLGH